MKRCLGGGERSLGGEPMCWHLRSSRLKTDQRVRGGTNRSHTGLLYVTSVQCRGIDLAASESSNLGSTALASFAGAVVRESLGRHG